MAGTGVTTSLEFDLPLSAGDYTRVIDSRIRVIVLICEQGEASQAIRDANTHQVGGEGFLWFGSEGLMNRGLWEDDSVMTADPVMRLHLLKGLFGVSLGQNRSMFAAYRERLLRLPATNGTDGDCNWETDDDVCAAGF